jgi:SET domain-containing protein
MSNHANGVKVPTATQAVILGLGSMFNHSTHKQNVGWTRDIANKVIIYKSLRDIKRGEELCISYGDRLTFVDADARLIHDSDEDEDVLSRIEMV